MSNLSFVDETFSSCQEIRVKDPLRFPSLLDGLFRSGLCRGWLYQY